VRDNKGMKISYNIQTILTKFKHQLSKKFPNQIKLILLFGSVARGTATNDSDVDILVVAKNKDRVTSFIDDFVLDIILKGGPYFSVILYNEKEYKSLTTPPTFFMREIQPQGIKI